MKHPNFKQAAESRGAALAYLNSWGATDRDGALLLGLWNDGHDLNPLGLPLEGYPKGCAIINLVNDDCSERLAKNNACKERLRHVAMMEAGRPARAFLSPRVDPNARVSKAQFVEDSVVWSVIATIRSSPTHVDAVVQRELT